MINNPESFDMFNDANIPVDIWLTPIELDEQEVLDNGERAKFKLKASNYMPRKAYVNSDGVEIVSDNVDELREIVRTRVIPIYEAALVKLRKMVEGTCDNLYYWD